MKIKSLSLNNFRRFEAFTTGFHPKLTVVVARNGQGKTSILDGIAIALGTFVGAFDMGKARSIERTDARYQRRAESSENEQQYPVGVGADISIANDETFKVLRDLKSPKGNTTTKDASELTEYGKSLMERVRELEDVTLPAISYYGSGRLWVVHKDMQRKKLLSESRSLGYEDCLTPASNFKQLQQWMGKATLAAMQQQQMSEYKGYTLADQVEGIQRAVDEALSGEGWRGFHYSLTHEELAVQHEELGLLPVSLLSDGVRAMVSLVADLAWRCAKLNPHFGQMASQKTPGIVLIDEVDLHLHPAWQQRVIRSLIGAFPAIQFIVTTHSPQVLSTVERDSIRIIKFDRQANSTSETPMAVSYGEESQNVLQAIMEVDPQPPIPERDTLERLTTLVESGNYGSEEAKSLLQQLRERLSANHPQIQRIERSIRRQEALRK